jgi:hypothetical protein
MPTAQFTHTSPVEASIEDAWQHMQSIDTWAGIGPVSYAENAVHDDDGVLRGFDWGADVGGKRYRGKASTVDWNRPDRFVLDMVTSEIVGNLDASLARSDGQNLVTVTITLSTKGMLSTMFFPAIRHALADGFPDQVNKLAAAM